MGGRDMAAVRLRLAAELRGRWRGTVALIVLLGLVGGGALAAAAGARRTATAPARLVEAVGGEGDVHIFDIGQADPAEVRALPGIDHMEALTFFYVDTVPSAGVDIVATDTPLFNGLVIDGRPPDPSDPYAAVLDAPAAEQTGLGVGDEVPVILATADELATPDAVAELEPVATVRVTAVIREPNDLVSSDPATSSSDAASIYLTDAFLDLHRERTDVINTVYSFKLTGGRGAAGDFVDAVRALPGGETVQFFEAPGVTPRHSGPWTPRPWRWRCSPPPCPSSAC